MYWHLKLLVAALFATSASFGPFFSLFMQDKGFNALQIGAMISLSRTVMLVTTPVVCAVADRRQTHREILAVLACGAAGTMVAFRFAPRGDFESAAFIFVLYACCSGSKMALCDTIVLHSCRGGWDRYPLQRLWGSISWGAVSLLIGYCLRLINSRLAAVGESSYEAVPLIHAGFNVAFMAVVVGFIPSTNGFARSVDEEIPCTPTAENLSRPTPPFLWLQTVSHGVATYWRVAKDRRVFAPIVGGVMILSTAEVALNNFLFPYMRKQLAAPPELFGYILALHSVSEVCAFAVSSKLLQRLGSPKWLLITSSIAFASKSFFYSIMSDPWSVLGVEWLHGMCFGFMWAGAVAHVSRCAASLAAKIEAEEMSALRPPSEEQLSEGPLRGEAGGGVRAASMAMTTLWFFCNGLPNIVGGLLSGAIVQFSDKREITLFHSVGWLCLSLVVAFQLYGYYGLFA